MPRLQIPFARRAVAFGAFSLLMFSAGRLPAQVPKPPVKATEPIVSLEAESETFEQVMKTLAAAAKVTIIVPDELKGQLITLHFGAMPLSQILTTALTATGQSLGYTEKNGVYTIVKAAPKPAPKPDLDHPLNMDMTDTDIRSTLFLLMKQAKIEFKIDDAVPHTKVTYHAKDKKLKTILSDLMNVSGKVFNYKVENDVYHFYSSNPKDAIK